MVAGSHTNALACLPLQFIVGTIVSAIVGAIFGAVVGSNVSTIFGAIISAAADGDAACRVPDA